ncbi:MAG: DUF1573 domain-containing protein [Syntrophobacteraceae bacterium]|jgi:ribosomal protein L30E|nr:DUF1573 domain-containing protein [Syntrophobacteraceae bacterium]
MKRIALPILLLGAVLMLAQCASTDEKPGAVAKAELSGGIPVAEFPSTEHNLGKIANDQEYSHVFVVRNTGSGVLQIKKVLPG